MVKNILLIQLGDIGDVVLTFPSIKAIKENFPQTNLAVAVRKKAEELIDDCIWVDKTVVISEKKSSFREEFFHQLKFFSNLRKYHFDLAIDLRTDTRGAFLALLSGAKVKIGFYDNNGEFWRNIIYTNLLHQDYKIGQYVADYYYSLLKNNNILTDHTIPEYIVPNRKIYLAKELLLKQGLKSDSFLVALQPFSLWQYKELKQDFYLQMIDWFYQKYNAKVIIVGCAAEVNRSFDLVSKCKQKVYNITGKTTIGLFAAVLKLCDLFIGIDSAGLHIAASVQTPTISFFGPSSSESWAPKGKNHKVIQKELACVPCRQKGCNNSEKSFCLDHLTFKETKNKISNFLNR